jgi:hypothetical protein
MRQAIVICATVVMIVMGAALLLTLRLIGSDCQEAIIGQVIRTGGCR